MNKKHVDAADIEKRMRLAKLEAVDDAAQKFIDRLDRQGEEYRLTALTFGGEYASLLAGLRAALREAKA